MSAQLEAFRVNTPFVNSTQPAFDSSSDDPFQVPLYAIWLNALWFVSLIFSLASATIGITVKQWLKEYNSGLFGSSRDVTRRRQYRYDNLQKWRVPTMVALVPVLLIIAVVLFLAGLLILLYSIHQTVALIASIFAGFLLLFVLVTTVLPTVFKTCCYYSPQAHTFLIFARGLVVLGVVVWGLILIPLIMWQPFVLCLVALGLSAPILALGLVAGAVVVPIKFFRTPLSERGRFFSPLKMFPLRIMARGFWMEVPQFARHAIHELHTFLMPPQVWRRSENAAVSVTRSSQLDVNVIITAFSAVLDVKALNYATACLTDEPDPNLWNGYVSKLSSILSSHGYLGGSRLRVMALRPHDHFFQRPRIWARHGRIARAAGFPTRGSQETPFPTRYLVRRADST